jgi:hypothetical protein
MIRNLAILVTLTVLGSPRCYAQTSMFGPRSRWEPQSNEVDSAAADDDDPGLDNQGGGPAGPADTNSPANADLFNRLNQMQSEIDALRAGGGASQNVTNPTRGLIPGERRSTDVPRIEDLKATPNFPRVRLTGFFQADSGWYSQDTRNTATLGNIQDVMGFRRTRLAAVCSWERTMPTSSPLHRTT